MSFYVSMIVMKHRAGENKKTRLLTQMKLGEVTLNQAVHVRCSSPVCWKRQDLKEIMLQTHWRSGICRQMLAKTEGPCVIGTGTCYDHSGRSHDLLTESLLGVKG